MAGDHPSLIRQTGPIALRVGHARNIEGSTSWRTQSSRSVVLHADPRKPVNKFEAAFRFVLVDCQPSTTSALSLPFPPPLFPPLPFTIFASSRTTRYFSHQIRSCCTVVIRSSTVSSSVWKSSAQPPTSLSLFSTIILVSHVFFSLCTGQPLPDTAPLYRAS